MGGAFLSTAESPLERKNDARGRFRGIQKDFLLVDFLYLCQDAAA